MGKTAADNAHKSVVFSRIETGTHRTTNYNRAAVRLSITELRTSRRPFLIFIVSVKKYKAYQ